MSDHIKKDECDRELADIARSFSWWTPVRKFFAAAAVAVTLGSGGAWLYGYLSEQRLISEHARIVDEVSLPYRSLDAPSRNLDSCIGPGDDLMVVNDSVVVFGEQMERSVFTASDTFRRDAGLCIRNIDGGQDISLEARAQVVGLDYGELEGFLRFPAYLDIVPRVPDIFPHSFRLDSIRLGDSDIPLDYVKELPPDEQNAFTRHSIDLVRLVVDGVIGSDDFDGCLDVSISAGLGIDDVPQIERAHVMGMDAYDSLPDYLKSYTVEVEGFPTKHERVQEVIREYSGSRDNVLDIIDYTLAFTTDSIEYCHRDNSNCPEGRYLPIPDILDQGGGVCAGYANVFVTLCRAFGIPSRYIVNNTLDTRSGNISGRHAWAEVALPLEDGSYRWVTVEPTWADNTDDPGSYINFTTPRYMYNIGLDVRLRTGNRAGRYGVVQETRWDSTARDHAADGVAENGPQQMEFHDVIFRTSMDGAEDD